MARLLLLFLILIGFGHTASATHVLGGDITWTCQGGDYVFQLTFYRDCQGPDVNTVSQTIEVWNHPSVTSITANFVSREDLSPICTQVPAGPVPISCGAGAFGGTGDGAIEKVIYRSNPISLPGTPPVEGWIFTYDNFSRSANITNIPTPDNYGITLTSKMFAIPGAPTGCLDNSPQFLQDPYFVSCVGDPYEYNMNAVDPDLDSLAISFGAPFNDFSGTYNPPTNPFPLPYEAGFSFTSPTPDASMNPLNVPASIDASSGNLTFQTFNTGNFVVKVLAQSYRQGVLISEIEREMQLIVQNCSGTNNAPVVTGPFGGLFETTVFAGDPVNFNLNSADIELLQDGTPQDNILTASGLMFGTNFTSTTGCAIAPCATLNTTPPITMSQGASTTFNWQTSCDHVVNPYGQSVAMVPYHFVFKVQDDYCPIPKVKYATVTINVVNQGIIDAPPINCIQTDAAGDVNISWNPVSDPTGSFVEYQIHSVQNGLLGSIATIGTNSFVDVGNGTQVNDYFIAVVSGCNGNTTLYSDTISNIYLDVANPSNGTAVLTWNDPINPPLTTMSGTYDIYREYPAGVWNLYTSVPYSQNNFIDTIDICFTDLNYQVVLTNAPCDYTSNIDGDTFEDMMTPDIPVISEISIDTNTNLVNISWNQNSHPDTYGYVIYMLDGSGVPIEIDTVWGIGSTSYSHSTNTGSGALSYTVAAFDSCWTAAIPPTYQTSAKAQVHTTNFVSASVNICDQTVSLNWTGYGGWDSVDRYDVYGYEQGGNWTLMGTTSGTTLNVSVNQAVDYCFAVEAVHSSGSTSFSNIACIYVALPSQPQFNYLKVGTINNEQVVLRYLIDTGANVPEVSLQRENFSGVFEEITRLSVSSPDLTYTDTAVDVSLQSYRYRVQIIDSCGKLGAYSNIAETIYTSVMLDDVEKINYIYWNAYEDFDGSILAYNVYRGINNDFSGAPIATLPDGTYAYEDDVNGVVSDGEICYRIEAVEATNSYNISERAFSNDVCSILTPIIYIPNAFSPDGDEINDLFMPVISDFDPVNFEFVIFSRWGQPIFRTNQPDEGWDGTVTRSGQLAQTGTYLYVLHSPQKSPLHFLPLNFSDQILHRQ